MKEISGNELFAKCIIANGIRYVFTVSTDRLKPLIKIMGAHKELKIIMARDETAATIMAGLGTIPADHEYSLGGPSYTSGEVFHVAIKEADVVIAIGVGFSGLEGFGLPPLWSDRIKFIHIDIDPLQIESDPSAFIAAGKKHISVYADPQSSLEFFESTVKKKKLSPWMKKIIIKGDAIAVNISKGIKGLDVIFSMLRKILNKNDIVIADGKDSCLAVSCYLRKAVYKDLFIMDNRNISGAGIPFAIGAAIGNPDSRVILICDKESLFHHVREVFSASFMGLEFNIICIDESNIKTNSADTARVLEGMGCFVQKFDPKKTKKDDLLIRTTNSPGAVIVT